MPINALIFLLGNIFFQQFSHLPKMQVMFLVIIFTGIIFFIPKKFFPFKKLLLIFIISFIWTYLYAYHQLSWELPKKDEGQTVPITGYIESIPETTPQKTAFLFRLKKLNNQPAHGLAKLSWRYNKEKLIVGDKWQFKVRLKQIHGLMNPGSFNYEAWAFQSGIRAEGYVVNSEENYLIKHQPLKNYINRLRQSLKEKLEAKIPQTNTSVWLIALALGERHNIPQEDWDVLRNTGTNHLMAIAGLHIGVMSGLIYFIVNFIWRRIPRLPLKLPAQHAASIAALIMAFIYSSLAGFIIPTQRAFIMVSIFLIVNLLKRNIPAWHAWGLALIIVLIMNPLTVLTESFWLSFGSVALIIYGMSARLFPKGIWWKWGRVQWVIALGLIPFGFWLFQQCSLVAFVANSIAIPWVAFVIVPLTLLGCLFISTKISAAFLLLADKNLSWLWKVLTYLSHFTWSSIYLTMPNIFILMLSCLGVILLLLPKGFPGRWFGIIWLMPLFLYKPEVPKQGEAWFTLLDVGQGLSAVIQTHNHLLVYDTGAKLGDNFDMGNSVVVPFLRTLRVKTIDTLVISNGENDHLGGAFSVLKQMHVRQIKTSVPEDFFQYHAERCLQNQSWNWDGVQFTFLYPSEDKFNLGKNSSCVLKVSTQKKSLLLTSDIDKAVEKKLVQDEKNNLTNDVLLAPHYGSKNAFEGNFMKTVSPNIVLYSVGYRNRFHFPNEDVINFFQKNHVLQYNTIKAGSIKLTIEKNNINIICFRKLLST